MGGTDYSENPKVDLSCGNFVALVWFIEKMRSREGGCDMNDLIIETKKKFDGITGIKEKEIPVAKDCKCCDCESKP